jgi:HSP20 family protein
MLARWSDFGRGFGSVAELRRHMDRLFEEYDGHGAEEEYAARAAWPRINVFDAGANLVVKAEVPGLAEKDLQITVNQDVLTVAGERKVDKPETHSVHRQERAPFRFSRSFTLPSKIDSEKTSAVMKDGVLTITLSKVPEAQPRQIAIRVQ